MFALLTPCRLSFALCVFIAFLTGRRLHLPHQAGAYAPCVKPSSKPSSRTAAAAPLAPLKPPARSAAMTPQTIEPDVIPDTVAELFNYLMFYASRGDLGVISTLDKKTFETRFTLFGRHEGKLIPLGFLSTTAGDEVTAPGETLPVSEFVIEPDRYDEWLATADLPHDLDRMADDGGPA